MGDFMSVKALNWAFNINIEPVKKVILLALADCADDDGKHCYPGYTHLANKASVCTKTIKRNIVQLVDLGLIKKHNRKKGQRYTSNEYELLLGVTAPLYCGDRESLPEPVAKNETGGDFESTGGDSSCPQMGTPEVPLSVKKTPVIDTDADEDLPEKPKPVLEQEEDFSPGIFGSHLLSTEHPYLYWFLRDMEKRAEQDPKSLGVFPERLVRFGLAGSYCRKSLDNFLNVRRHSIDDYLCSLGRQDAIAVWEKASDDLIADADNALEEFREYLANTAA